MVYQGDFASATEPSLCFCMRATGARHAGRKAWMPGPWPSASSCSDWNCGSSQWTAEEKVVFWLLVPHLRSPQLCQVPRGGVVGGEGGGGWGALPLISRYCEIRLSSRVRGSGGGGEWSWSAPPPLLNSSAADFKSRKNKLEAAHGVVLKCFAFSAELQGFPSKPMFYLMLTLNKARLKAVNARKSLFPFSAQHWSQLCRCATRAKPVFPWFFIRCANSAARNHSVPKAPPTPPPPTGQGQ